MVLLTRLLLNLAGIVMLLPAFAIDPDSYVSSQKGKGNSRWSPAEKPRHSRLPKPIFRA